MNHLSPILLIALLRFSSGLIFRNPGSQKYSKSAFVDRIFHSSLVERHRKATKEDTDTWSKTAGRRESRLGVRRRVRAVLKRARERTGVENDSELSLLGADSNLGLEATLPSLPVLNFDNLDLDLLGADATLSMGIAADMNVNGNNAQPLNGATKNGAAVNDQRASGANGDKAPVERIELAAEPLPFTLPALSEAQKEVLVSGERVQEQSKMGREGSGFVVMDIPAPEYAIWEVLLDFEAYPQNIGTVRGMRMFTNTHLKQSYHAEKALPPGAITRHFGKSSISRASFILSKFRLNIAAVHKYVPHPDGHYMVFTLDKATKNAVFQDAKGIWFSQENPDGRVGYTRVWLLCELSVSPLFPTWIVDYAAKRAMPRATTWLPGLVQQYIEKGKIFMDV